MRRSWLIVFITFLVLVTFFGSTTFAYADLEQRLNQTRQQLDSTREQADSVRGQVESITQEVASLDTSIQARINHIQELDAVLEEVEMRLQQAQRELEEAEERLEERNEIFGERVRTAYQKGNISYLEVLLGAENLSDLISRLEFIKYILASDVELIEAIEAEREVVEQRKKEIEEREREVAAVRTEQEHAYQALVNEQREKETVLVAARGEYRDLQSEVDALERAEQEITRQIAQERGSSGEALHSGRFSWPVPGYSRVSSDFGYRTHPILGVQRFHNGIDIPAPHGAPVTAAGTGRVIYVGSMQGYGNTVIVDHGGSVTSLYAHLSTMNVSEGQAVASGETIARIGTTGMSTGPHLHFTVQEHGNAVSPWNYLR